MCLYQWHSPVPPKDPRANALQFLHTIDEILFANIDVTSSVLAFLLINLARNDTAQTALRAEILQHTGDFEAYLRKADSKLEYTCMESIRLCPAACKPPQDPH